MNLDKVSGRGYSNKKTTRKKPDPRLALRDASSPVKVDRKGPTGIPPQQASSGRLSLLCSRLRLLLATAVWAFPKHHTRGKILTARRLGSGVRSGVETLSNSRALLPPETELGLAKPQQRGGLGRRAARSSTRPWPHSVKMRAGASFRYGFGRNVPEIVNCGS